MCLIIAFNRITIIAFGENAYVNNRQRPTVRDGRFWHHRFLPSFFSPGDSRFSRVLGSGREVCSPVAFPSVSTTTSSQRKYDHITNVIFFFRYFLFIVLRLSRCIPSGNKTTPFFVTVIRCRPINKTQGYTGVQYRVQLYPIVFYGASVA